MSEDQKKIRIEVVMSGCDNYEILEDENFFGLFGENWVSLDF